MFAKNVAHRDRLFMQNFSASSNSPLRDYFSLSLSLSLSLFPSDQINNQALCVPTGNDPYSPIIRSRLQPFDTGAPQERAREGKGGRYRRQICAPTTVALANRLWQTTIVCAALAWKRTTTPGYRLRGPLSLTSG